MPADRHWESADFIKIAKRCTCGDADAMWDFGSYLFSLGMHPFYEYAANFWRYRACDFSRLDKRNHEKKFQALHDAAAAAIGDRLR